MKLNSWRPREQHLRNCALPLKSDHCDRDLIWRRERFLPTVFADCPSPAKLLTPPSLRENHQLDLYLQTLEDGPLKTLMQKKVDEDDTVGHRRQSFWRYKQWAENELSRVEKRVLKREQWQCYVTNLMLC